MTPVLAGRRWETPIVLAVTNCPKSLNASNHPASHAAFLREKAAWEKILHLELLQSALPRGVSYVHADALMRFPIRRDRDAGNFQTLLAKALGDALQGGKASRERYAAPRGKRGPLTPQAKHARATAWLQNDTASSYQFGLVTVDNVRGPKLTRIRLAWIR